MTPVPADSPWARRARFLAGISQLALKKYDEAFATFGLLADVQPTPTVLNNQGVAQLRRPATGVQSADRTASFFFKKAAEADPDDPDYLFNLGYASWQNHDTQAAIYWLREAVRRNPADGDAHFVLGAALAAAGNTMEAGREKELAKRLSANYEELDKRSGTEPVPQGLERIKTKSSCRTRGGSKRGSRQAGSAIRRSTRRSTWIAHAACTRRKTIAMPRSN